MVGVINISSSSRVLDLMEFANKYPRIGISDKNGMLSAPSSSLSVYKPPSTVVSPSFTRTSVKASLVLTDAKPPSWFVSILFFIAAIVIAIVGVVIKWGFDLLGFSIDGGLLGAIIHLVVAAVVLMISDKLLPGLKVAGFVGALVAATAIGAVHFVISFVIGLLV